MSLPSVASATVWNASARGADTLVEYQYDDVDHHLELSWVELPDQAGLPLTVVDGAMSIIFWDNNGVLSAEIDIDIVELTNNSPAIYGCVNHMCDGYACIAFAGHNCELSDYDTCVPTNLGECEWVSGSECSSLPCSTGPGDPPEHLILPVAIAPFDPLGQTPVPPT
ncbi:hypothetical protein SAMN02745121_06158 [Nannocystis exedens]|uniref:Uncharacterized protein n=1 Tax=Nannocystis exedens TaxID=54 RepID=A0A1I2EMX1_9BACT|nr:hypothetical protein [Nannocystis exedens]PCC73922.1 hypothetical protein NAEX_07011 [Nannocystis exedens]SFE94205.1 hypothetical protein SAMN02745121_06158 [Nannocystis exedens]